MLISNSKNELDRSFQLFRRNTGVWRTDRQTDTQTHRHTGKLKCEANTALAQRRAAKSPYLRSHRPIYQHFFVVVNFDLRPWPTNSVIIYWAGSGKWTYQRICDAWPDPRLPSPPQSAATAPWQELISHLTEGRRLSWFENNQMLAAIWCTPTAWGRHEYICVTQSSEWSSCMQRRSINVTLSATA